MSEDRKTFTVPPGYVALFDGDGRATGEIAPITPPNTVGSGELDAAGLEAAHARVKVKALEWSEDGFNRADDYAVLSAAGQGPKPFMLVRGSRLVGHHESVEAGKAAAQRDYETRVRSALIR